mgnify:CR=1 FL=1
MKNLIYYLLPLLIIACNSETKEIDNSVQNLKEYSINQFMDNESVNGGSFSPDKSKLLVTSNRTGVYNMYTVSTKTGEFIPESKSDSSSVFSISYFPNDDRILFRMDENGNELEFVDKIISKSHELREELNEKIEELVANFYKKINVAHLDEIKALNIKLEKLEANVALLEARLNKLES